MMNLCRSALCVLILLNISTVQMADETEFHEILQKVLENLNFEDLAKFQTRLMQGVDDKFAPIPKSTLQSALVRVTVREMVQAYGGKKAVEVGETALTTINHRYLAKGLTGIKESFQPVVPYEQVLYDGLNNKTVITIQGKVKENADQFYISLIKDIDVAFRFNPRFNKDGTQVIVRNSKINHIWGPEERETPLFPFTPGKPFELKILCTDSEFRVEVDKKPLLTYTHRIKEIDQIRILNVYYDVSIESVNIDPTPLWTTAPFTHVLSYVISENMNITIPGHIKPNAQMFTINVMKDNDIFLHLRSYFADDGKGIEIVRNSRIDGVWGREETETPYFPFAWGKPFLMKILCTETKFKVYDDDAHLLDYTYRGFDFSKINKVGMGQDVITWAPLWTTSSYAVSYVISENMNITIPGHVKLNAKQFRIDVMKDNDIFLHLRSYFADDGKGREIVRNSRIDGVWGREEKDTPYFPFAWGKPFVMKILCTKTKFKVYVDDSHLLDYTYRGFDFTKINNVVIGDDVITWYVQVQPCTTRMC